MTLADYRGHRAAEELPLEGPATAGEDARHPGPLEYAQIGVVLAIITAMEVAVYYLDVSHAVLVGVLVIMSAIKFSLVVLWFMHLRFDNRLFSSLFVMGLMLAFAVFVVALSTIGGKLV